MRKSFFSKIISIALAILVVFTFMPVGASAAAVKKPAKVKFAKCSVTASSVTLKWKKAKNAKKYEVYQLKAKKYKKIKTVKKTKLVVKKLKANTKYSFKVRAINGKKNGKFTVKTIKTKTKRIKVNFLNFEKSYITLKEGSSAKSIILFTPNNANKLSKIKFRSSNSAVATASLGELNTRKGSFGKIYAVIKAHKAGRAVITISLDGIKGEIDVNVDKKTAPVKEDSISTPEPKKPNTPNIIIETPKDRPEAKIPSGWTPDKGFEMFTSDFSDDADLSAAFGFGNDACVLTSIKYSKGVDKNSPTLDKIRCVAEWMADNLSYCVNPVKNKVTRATACAGYASYYEYLLNTYFDVETIGISAYPEEANHAWNMVKYNGNWYAVDVTWFDIGLPGEYNFAMFMKSSAYLLRKDPFHHWYGTPEETAAYCKANNYISSYFTVATATDMDDYDWSAYGWTAPDCNLDEYDLTAEEYDFYMGILRKFSNTL